MHVTLRNPNCQKTVLDNGATLVNGVNPIQGSRLIFLLVAREEAVAFASAKKPLSGKES